jgi:hypothetical protein
MQRTKLPNHEAAILGRLLEPDRPTLPATAARALLDLDFCQEDRDRMSALAAKARAGTLTPDEQTEIEAYSRVGSLLSILKSKARKSLKSRRDTAHRQALLDGGVFPPE